MMESFGDMTVERFLEALASSEPVPGGGSAAAVSIALAAGLVEMVAALSKKRAKDDAEAANWEDTAGEAASLRSESLRLADEDSRAFARVMEAVRLPKGTGEEAERRRTALAEANAVAASVPLQTAMTGLAVLRLAAVAAARGNPHAISDAGAAGALAAAGIRGAALNVRINLPGLPGEAQEELLVKLEPVEREMAEMEMKAAVEVRRRMG